MSTVSVQFLYTWITNPSTNQSVSGPNPKREGQATLAGSFRPYAGGRMRVITSLADTHARPIMLQSLTDAQLTLLTSWRGQALLLRDGPGWRTWGSYIDLKWNDVPGPTGMIHDVSLTFYRLSYNEAT